MGRHTLQLVTHGKSRIKVSVAKLFMYTSVRLGHSIIIDKNTGQTADGEIE